jgi:F420-non-reducing hydrogenase iron-sulfur subunit
MAEQLGIDKRRLRLEWISASEGKRLQEVVNEMTETLRQLGPSKIKETVETLVK